MDQRYIVRWPTNDLFTRVSLIIVRQSLEIMNMDLLTCPRCKSVMHKIEEPDITVDRCSECGGTFLDKGELDVLATGMSGEIEFCSVDREERTDKHAYIECPKVECEGNRMRKINLLIYSDIIFDHCEKCAGFFLDSGEITEMNQELEQLTPDKEAEEFRNYIDGHLVRKDSVSSVTTTGGSLLGHDVAGVLLPGHDVATAAHYLKLSVYFKENLGLGLRVFSEKWADKLFKVMGLSKKQDIQIGDDEIDSSFIIQGEHKKEVLALLSDSQVQKNLKKLKGKEITVANAQGKLEILDERIVYTEGPYIGVVSYDITEDETGAIKAMLDFAKAVEAYYG